MPGLVLQKRRRPEEEGAAEVVRYGLTASRRVGNAVARNRARRRLRAIAEQVLPSQAEIGCDYVLIGRAATLNRPFAALMGDLEHAIARLSRQRQQHRPERRQRRRTTRSSGSASP